MKTIIEEGEPPITPSVRRREARRESKPADSSLSSLRINTILVPLDFSRHAMRALDFAKAIGEKFDAQIHLLHVEAPDEACAVPGGGHLMRECAEAATFMREKLAGIEYDAPPHFWPENCHIRTTGRPYQQICAVARELKADLIVLGSRGNTGLKRVVLGSTAERVVRSAPCPVLVVRDRKGKNKSSSPNDLTIRTILAPVDFSLCSIAGTMYAALLAKSFHAKLRLFHALQPLAPVVLDRVTANLGSVDEIALTNARLEMEALGKVGYLSELKPSGEVHVGSPLDSIVDETYSPDVDLVVISTHGRGGFERLLLGSVAEHVVRRAECPVMVVPSRYAKF